MKRWVLVIVAALLVFSMACSVLDRGGDAEPEPDVEVVVSDGEEAEVEADVEDVEPPAADVVDVDESAPPVIAEDALEGLDSYRSRFNLRTEFEDGTVQEIAFEQEATRDPLAQRMLMSSSEGDASEDFEFIRVGDSQWTRFGEEWIQSTMTEEEMDFQEGMIYSYEDFSSFADDDDYEYLGKEKVNGVQTKHYRLDLDPLSMAALTSDGEVKDVEAEVWVAHESDLPEFPMRFVMSAEVTSEVDGEIPGTVFFEQEVYDVNASFIIEPPEEALSGGLPSDIPMYPNASEVTSMAGMVFFSSSDEAGTIADFYRDALESAGWSQTESNELEGLVMETWTKEEQTLSLMISAEDAGGSSVTIMVE